MGSDRHSSKSSLGLSDGFRKKPGKFPENPHVYEACEEIKKTCPEEKPKTFWSSMGDYPRPFRTFGPKQFEALSQYKGSVLAYGLATFLGTIYLCEWKAMLQYLPYYIGVYARDD
ncbi:hypothetical protein HUJ04_009167 [Dendroctonus ponderosae]